MGMQAAYMLVDEETLDRLVDLDPDDLLAALSELEEQGAATFYLDKTWDGLHFLLTGRSASRPREGDPLSEAVVGVHALEGDDYVGVTEVSELAPVLTALDGFDLDRALLKADFASYDAAGLYPRMWTSDAAGLRAELAAAYALVVEAHRTAAARGRHLVVSIV